jgi:hypothetical protein
VRFLRFLCEIICHDINVIVHAFVIIEFCSLVSVIKVGGESAFFSRSLLQHFPCLVEVDLGVSGWHMYCAEVVEVVEHRVLVDVDVYVLSVKPMY